MGELTLRRPARVRGDLVAPGDKSISHRALILAAMAEGTSQLRGRAPGEDQDSMVRCLRALGVEATDRGPVTTVSGVGLRGLSAPSVRLDCGNSGATMRFLAGALAGIEGADALLDGDDSLRRRPMDRVAVPLRAMGAEVDGAGGLPPVHVVGRALVGVEHDLPMASAQVKTAILLAGLNAFGDTTLREPVPTRDHTERLLRRLGVGIEVEEGIRLTPPDHLPGFDLEVPGDPSAAAFFVVLASAHPDAEVVIRNVCLNPTRAGFLDVLGRMGADIQVIDLRELGGEPVADLRVVSAVLSATDITPAEVPSLVDEIPVLAVAAAVAAGESRFRGLAELRVKEVDRLASVAAALVALGAHAEVEGDDLVVTGGRLHGAAVASGGDHRMAMSLAVAGSLAEGDTRVDAIEAAAVSYPGFARELAALTEG